MNRSAHVASQQDAKALAVLARNHRLLVILIPRGVPTESIQEIKRDVDERLDELVKERGPMA